MLIKITKKHLITYLFIVMSYVFQAQNVQLVNSSHLADVLIKKVDNPEYADLLVYKSLLRVPSYVNNGVWYYLPEHSEDYGAIKIYYTSYKRYNTINVYFVSHRYKARWKNIEKKYLLKK